MEKNAEGNGKMLYRTLRSVRKEKTNPVKNMKNKKGEIVTSEKEILEIWKEHFVELLGGDGRVNKDKIRNGTQISEEMARQKDEICMEEMTNAIKKIKAGKAPGVDEIRPEMIKYMGMEGTEILRKIICKAYESKTMPKDWKIAVITPIHKKGDTMKCSNYRGISLLCVCYKIYERIIEERLRAVLEPTFLDTQAGFRTSRSTQDWIFVLKQLEEKVMRTNENIYACTIDLEKAFDSVPREKIWNILRAREIDKDTLEAVKSMYNETLNVVRIGGNTTNSFETSIGVRQGGILSPLLFITLMDELAREVKAETRATFLGHWKMKPIRINELLYADDLVLIARRKKDIESRLEKWREILEKYNLKINTHKTEVISIARKPEDTDITLDGNEIQGKRNIKYLGARIDEKGDIEIEISSRISNTMRVYWALYQVCFNKKELTKRTKVKIYETILAPILMYGCESWVLSERMKSRIQACEMKILRKIEGVTRRDKLRNENIRQKLNMKGILEKIETQQLRWFGHLVRKKEDDLVKMIWEVKFDGKTVKGRPRKTWNSSVGSLLEKRELNWTQAKTKAENRKEWRKFITSTPHGTKEVGDK